jgi:hypothetical protein
MRFSFLSIFSSLFGEVTVPMVFPHCRQRTKATSSDPAYPSTTTKSSCPHDAHFTSIFSSLGFEIGLATPFSILGEDFRNRQGNCPEGRGDSDGRREQEAGEDHRVHGYGGLCGEEHSAGAMPQWRQQRIHREPRSASGTHHPGCEEVDMKKLYWQIVRKLAGCEKCGKAHDYSVVNVADSTDAEGQRVIQTTIGKAGSGRGKCGSENSALPRTEYKKGSLGVSSQLTRKPDAPVGPKFGTKYVGRKAG